MRARVSHMLILGLLGACRDGGGDPGPPERALAPGATVRILEWADHPALIGLSGLAQRTAGEVWAAPERSGQLVALPFDPARGLGPPRVVPVVGVPKARDIEALAFVDGDLLLLGTEGPGARAEDPIYLARITARGAEVLGVRAFDYRAFDTTAVDNKGVEGLCVTGTVAVAASERVIAAGDARVAPVARFALDAPEAAPRPYRVRLRSAKGKLSALACRAREGAIEVHAIERHYGVMRLVRFVLGEAASVDAELVVDLAPHLGGPHPPNLEGLDWVGPRALLAVSDNHHGRKSGPSTAVLIELPRAATATSPARR